MFYDRTFLSEGGVTRDKDWDRVSTACVRVKPLDILEEGPQCFNVFNVFLTAMFVEGYFKPKYDLILTQPSGFCG